MKRLRQWIVPIVISVVMIAFYSILRYHYWTGSTLHEGKIVGKFIHQMYPWGYPFGVLIVRSKQDTTRVGWVMVQPSVYDTARIGNIYRKK